MATSFFFGPIVRNGENKINTGRMLFGYGGLGDFVFRVLSFPCPVAKRGGSSVLENPRACLAKGTIREFLSFSARF